VSLTSLLPPLAEGGFTRLNKIMRDPSDAIRFAHYPTGVGGSPPAQTKRSGTDVGRLSRLAHTPQFWYKSSAFSAVFNGVSGDLK